METEFSLANVQGILLASGLVFQMLDLDAIGFAHGRVVAHYEKVDVYDVLRNV